jgi:hypothetical protein
VTGVLKVSRLYLVCVSSTCRDSAIPLDERLGLTSYLSPEARRLLCLAGSSWTFDIAQSRLKEFAGISASDELIRQVTDAVVFGERPGSGNGLS